MNSKFIIEYDRDQILVLFVEPEGMIVELQQDETVIVVDDHKENCATIRVSSKGLSIWPGDENTQVFKNGQNVLA